MSLQISKIYSQEHLALVHAFKTDVLNSKLCPKEATKKVVNFADVEEPHRLPFLLDSLDVQIQFKGPDVLGGFAEIAAASGKQALFSLSV